MEPPCAEVNQGVFSIADVPTLIGQGITKYEVRTCVSMCSITKHNLHQSHLRVQASARAGRNSGQPLCIPGRKLAKCKCSMAIVSLQSSATTTAIILYT